MPFHAVATYALERGYNAINRIDGRRTVTVSANADLNVVEPARVAGTVFSSYLPGLLAKYPDVGFDVGTSLQEQQDSVWEMIWGFMGALVGIYVLMAIPLKSYLQPLVIMTRHSVRAHWRGDRPLDHRHPCQCDLHFSASSRWPAWSSTTA